MAGEPIRALLFDVDGVLVHSRTHPDVTRRRLWEEHLLADMGVDPARFQKLFGPTFEQVVKGQRSLVDVLDEFLPTVGYGGSTLSFITYWMERDSHINHELIEAIVALRRRANIKVFLATNQEHHRAAFLWREFRLAQVFDDILYSARLGAIKPDHAFFERASAHLPDLEEPPLFFDDSPACVEAGNAFGWDSVKFTDVEHFTSHPWIAYRLA